MFAGEYAAQHFSSGDPRKLEKLLFDGGEKEDAAGLTSLDKQELEMFYTVFPTRRKFGSSLRRAVLHEVAIRTMEGLIQSRGAGHPLLILAMATVYGLKHALDDFRSFASSGKAPLSKYAPVELTYLDYLRLFLLLHGTGDAGMSRMIAVIEHNTRPIWHSFRQALRRSLRRPSVCGFCPERLSFWAKQGCSRGR